MRFPAPLRPGDRIGVPSSGVPDRLRPRLEVGIESLRSRGYDVVLLHGLRLAGWFEHVTGILIGRTGAPDRPGLTQREAVVDALGPLDVPVVLDVECGHQQPFLPLVPGALGRVVVDDERREIAQTFA